VGGRFLGAMAMIERDLTFTEAHRPWMVRNRAPTFAAVMLRLWLPGPVAAGAPFHVAYPAIAWLCWVPSLLVAELLLQSMVTPSR
jgi:hypothetical protein